MAGARSHGLCPAVDPPHHGERRRISLPWELRNAPAPARPIRAFTAAERMSPGGHEAFDVAVVGNESVYEFPDGIGEQERRSDHSQLRSIQRSAVENGFLHDIETRAADIVETVSERRRRECLQTQAAVVFASARRRPSRGPGPGN